MQRTFIYLAALFFFVMGVTALLKPTSITRFFALSSLPAAMRNEVRAVYGGFGVAVAGLLLAASTVASIRSGVLLTVSVFSLGMAGGRLVSFAVDREVGWTTAVFFVLELLLGGSLLYAWSIGSPS